MSTIKVACRECGAMILPSTAAKNDGMCAHCGAMSESDREERRAYELSLQSGSVYIPSSEERESATTPSEFGDPTVKWDLEPDYYASDDSATVSGVLTKADKEPNGNVFLVSSSGARVNLFFTDSFAVCEYEHRDEGKFLYAYTQKNLREQVSKEQHVEQACPCCGVGMLWFPSRFHMPRRLGFDILKAVVSAQSPKNVEWFESCDFSRTERGRG